MCRRSADRTYSRDVEPRFQEQPRATNEDDKAYLMLGRRSNRRLKGFVRRLECQSLEDRPDNQSRPKSHGDAEQLEQPDKENRLLRECQPQRWHAVSSFRIQLE